MRRTNYCETCPGGDPDTKGASLIYWSPSQRFISYTAFVDQAPVDTACMVFIVPSDPIDGNAIYQFTFPPFKKHDYNPSWSPLNDFIVFERGDSAVIKKGVPWLGNPTETVVTASSNCPLSLDGDALPAVSPDGQWVAFSRCGPDPIGGWSLWKIPIAGGTAVQLTPTASRADFYPSWSPDGQTIYFQRKDAAVGPGWTLWKVPAAGGAASAVFVPPASPISDAVQPAPSPDGKILLAGYGKRDELVRKVITHTLDPTLLFPNPQKVIPNYPDTNFAEKGGEPILSPRLSPDGTRTALGSKQVWAARRNMNLPPAFTSVTSTYEETRSVPDTAATMTFVFNEGGLNFITVLASDPDDVTLIYRADFLQSWMVWDEPSRTLTASTNPSLIGQFFYVKFWVTTASGGTDAFIAVINIQDLPLSPRSSSEASLAGMPEHPDGPNPTRGTFALGTPLMPGVIARLSVLDLSGRLVAVVRAPAGSPLRWEGRDRSGRRAPPGVYLYRMEVGKHRKEGKVVVVR